jgi:hypothetical protein
MPENAILLLTSLLPITPNSHLRTQISPHLPAVKSYITHTSKMEHHSSTPLQAYLAEKFRWAPNTQQDIDY